MPVQKPSAVALVALAASHACLRASFGRDVRLQQGVVLNGTVKEFQYTNPHSWIQLVVAGRERRRPRGMEHRDASADRALRAGIKPTSLQPGDKISLKMHPLKDGAPGGSLVEVKKADGTTLTLRGPRSY
jgi:hypothetical protein